MLGGLAGSLVAGVALLLLVPNRLEWSSDAPYLSSLTTMASFEHSNGRVDLWRVGLQMIASEPLLGVGTGSYPVLWRDYIKDTNVDARAFAFLRSDLPVYNDYLQRAIENGVPAGLLAWS